MRFKAISVNDHSGKRKGQEESTKAQKKKGFQFPFYYPGMIN